MSICTCLDGARCMSEYHLILLIIRATENGSQQFIPAGCEIIHQIVGHVVELFTSTA